MNKQLKEYLEGEKLYGDDFTEEEIRAWYQDEKEAYADLGAKEYIEYTYVYEQLNIYHGYRRILNNRFRNALGLGSAYGDEFNPVMERIDHVTILESSDVFKKRSGVDIPFDYVAPTETGKLPFQSKRFDLITCFGVMHHIPNVSYVLGECYRCLENEGYYLLREPIVSMGDWTKTRGGSKPGRIR